ncbi:MAG: 50S ribosomal L9 C-terminal domain-containing protein [bacterium]
MDKKWIIIDEPIQHLGVYSIKIQFSPEISSSIRLWVVKA